jgi:hypothetical protein
MPFELVGKIIEIYDTVNISDTFKKREFVIEKKENDFIDYVKFQVTQDRVSMLDDFKVDDEVKVTFNIRGNRWERDGNVNYFTNLGAWRIEKLSGTPESGIDAPFPEANDMPDEPGSAEDDLPF